MDVMSLLFTKWASFNFSIHLEAVCLQCNWSFDLFFVVSIKLNIGKRLGHCYCLKANCNYFHLSFSFFLMCTLSYTYFMGFFHAFDCQPEVVVFVGAILTLAYVRYYSWWYAFVFDHLWHENLEKGSVGTTSTANVWTTSTANCYDTTGQFLINILVVWD